MSKKMIAAAPLLAFALVLSACNGGTDTASPPAQTTPPSPGPASPGAAEEQTVRVVDNDFLPREITVASGSSVKWVWEGEMQHAVTADDGSFDSQVQSKGFEFEQTFSTPGRVEYFCSVHSSADGSTQNGVVVVT